MKSPPLTEFQCAFPIPIRSVAQRGHEDEGERHVRPVRLASQLLHVLGEPAGLRVTGGSSLHIHVDEVIEHLLSGGRVVEREHLLHEVLIVRKAGLDEITRLAPELETDHRTRATSLPNTQRHSSSSR